MPLGLKRKLNLESDCLLKLPFPAPVSPCLLPSPHLSQHGRAEFSWDGINVSFCLCVNDLFPVRLPFRSSIVLQTSAIHSHAYIITCVCVYLAHVLHPLVCRWGFSPPHLLPDQPHLQHQPILTSCVFLFLTMHVTQHPQMNLG